VNAPTSLAITRMLVALVLLADLLQAKYAHAANGVVRAAHRIAWGALLAPEPFLARWSARRRNADALWWLAVLCSC